MMEAAMIIRRMEEELRSDYQIELVEASTDVLHYRRVGKEQTAEIILNNGPHLIVRTAFGKQTEVNPGGFTILVEDNQPQHVGYFKYY